MTSVMNINDVLEGHVGLDLDCVDRLYLNAYVPNLQVGGQVVTFLTGHLGLPIASPVVIEKIGNRFRREVKAFADEHDIPILHLKKPDRTRWDDRKLDHVRPYLEQAEREGRFGVVAIVAAQEFQWVFSAKNDSIGTARVASTSSKSERRVGTYYFYILDPEFGPGFIKICTYFPYPAKVWVNGHEWAKRQARRAGLVFSRAGQRLRHLHRPRAPPGHLRPLRARRRPGLLRPLDHRAIPTPFTEDDRAAGYFWELSMRQVEVSRTLVFDDPRRARGFFEALVDDNVGIGRPDEVATPSSGPVRRRGRTRPRAVPHPGLRPRHRGEDGLPLQAQPGQAVPEGREGPSNRNRHQQAHGHRRPRPGSSTCPSSSSKARQVNDRLLMIERAGQGCAIGSALFERIHQPYKVRANEPEPCASGINAPWPWPVHCASSSMPSPASPTRAFAGWWPDSSAGTTARAR